MMGTWEGRPASQPGFLLFCTQNPSHLQGRTELSEALQSRLLKIPMPDLTDDDMHVVLEKSYGLNEEQRSTVIRDFHPKNKARLAAHLPPCTFRDVVTEAKAPQKSRLGEGS